MLITDRTKRTADYLLSFCIFIPVFIYVKTVGTYALNIPFQDDYDCILKFLCKYKSLPFIDKISALFAQEAEHRTFLLKAIIVANYSIMGNVNFRHLIFVVAIILMAIFVIATALTKKYIPGKWKFGALILSLSLFDLNNFENSDFASAGLFNYGVIMLFMLSLLLYGRTDNKLTILAILIQVLCIFSGGNGMIGAFFITIYTLLNKDRLKTVASISVLLIFCPLYFYHYTFSHANSSFFVLDLKRNLRLFLNALGANFGGKYSLVGGIIIIVLLSFLILVRKLRMQRNSLPILCTIGFALASLAVMSVFRGKLDTTGVAYSPRYLIYSHIIIALLSVYFLGMIKKNAVAYIYSAAFALLLYYQHYGSGKANYKVYYTNEKNTDYCYPESGKVHAKEVAEDACRQNIYCIENHRSD